MAATIAVDDPSPVSLPGHCTLIDAVQAVNTQLPVNTCVAGDGNADTIDLGAFTSPTTIEFGQATPGYYHALALTRRAIIRGPLAADGSALVTLTRSTVSSPDGFGLIDATASLTLYGLKLTAGAAPYGGGAVSVGGDLTLDHCEVSNNHANGSGGGAAATGQLTVRHSIISGNITSGAGGGLLTNSTLDVYYSTITNNQTTDANGRGGGGVYAAGIGLIRGSVLSANTSASKGGALYVASDVNLIDSTVSGNKAAAGGGVFALSYAGIFTSTLYNNSASVSGGALYASDAVIENSTFTGNSAFDAGAVHAGTLALSYGTLTANLATNTNGSGAAIVFTTTANAHGTIAIKNSPQDIQGAASASVAGQFNLIGTSNVPLPADTLTCDPQLAPLADNGGPTRTLAPAAGSCAIDAASSTPSVVVDQRHLPRPANGTAHFRADIGAFETQGASNPDVVFASNFE